jgi:hypothetical protein
LVLDKDGGLLQATPRPLPLGSAARSPAATSTWRVQIEDVVGLFLWALDDHRVWE